MKMISKDSDYRSRSRRKGLCATDGTAQGLDHDRTTSRPRKRVCVKSSFSVGLIAFSPDGRYIAVTLGEQISLFLLIPEIISDRRCEFMYRSTIRSMAFYDLGYIVCATSTALFTTQLCDTPGGRSFVIMKKMKYLAPVHQLWSQRTGPELLIARVITCILHTTGEVSGHRKLGREQGRSCQQDLRQMAIL